MIVEEGAGGGKGICYKMHRISMGVGIRCKSKVGIAEGAATAGREQPGPGAGWSWLRRSAAAEAGGRG